MFWYSRCSDRSVERLTISRDAGYALLCGQVIAVRSRCEDTVSHILNDSIAEQLLCSLDNPLWFGSISILEWR